MTLSTAALLIVRMTRTCLLGAFFLLCCHSLFSQSTDSCTRLASFQKAYHSQAKQYLYDAVQLPNGDIAACGEYVVSLTNSTNTEALAMRFSATGEVIWATRYGVLAKGEKFLRIKPTADGGVIACGYTESLTPRSVMLAVKFSATGQVQWSSAFNAFSTNGETAADIVQTSDGGYAVVGTYNAYIHENSDIIVLKLASNGTQSWCRIYEGGVSDWGTGVATLGDTIVVTGYSDIRSGSHSGFMMKIRSADGSYFGGKLYDRGGKDERFGRLEPYAGGFVIREQTADDRWFSNMRFAITDINTNGDVLLSKKTFFNPSAQNTVMYKRTSDNGYIGVTGDQYTDPRIFKLDATGNVEWKRMLPRYGDQQLHTIFQLADGSYMAAGQYGIDFSADVDAYLVKLNAQGETSACAMDSIMPLTIEDAPLTVQPLNWLLIRPVVLNVVNTSALTATTPVEQVNELCSVSPCDPPPSTCFTTYQKTYTGGGDDEGLNIMHTADGGSLVCGRTTSGTAGNRDGTLIKFDGQGVVQWSKKYGGNQNDQLERIIATSDGNYVAAGITYSFGYATGALWIMKTDVNGNVIWSRQYSGNGRERARKLLELSNGQLLIAGNTKDSTAQNNAWLLQLTPSGDVTWSKQYDHGNDDGFHDVIQLGDTLVLTGYATVGKKTGVLAKVRVSDGGAIWAQQYKKQVNTNIELTNLYSIPQGYSFTAWSNEAYKGGAYLKSRPNGETFFEVQWILSTASGYKIESFTSIDTKDTGIVFLINDTTPRGFPLAGMIGPTGNGEWSRSFNESFLQTRLYGMSQAKDRGYLMTGYTNHFLSTNDKKRIRVVKTDDVGRTGQCDKLVSYGTQTDTSHFSVTSFAWANVSDYVLAQSGVINTQASDYPLTIFTECAKTVCDSGQQQMSDSCSSTFKFDITGRYNVLSPTAIRTSDGGYMIGGDYVWGNQDPVLIRLAANGNIQWAKTFNDIRHTGGFRTLLNTPDGHVLAVGIDAFELDHGVSSNIIALKIDYTGQVLWMKRFGGSGNVKVKLTSDGGILMIINRNIGFPPLYNYLVKLDLDGNIIWQKEANRYVENSIVRDVIIDGSVFYTIADFYNPSPRNHLEINKCDLSTGQTIYTKRLIAPDRHMSVQRAFLENDTLFVAVGTSYSPAIFQVENRLGIVKLNPQTGMPYSVWEINTPRVLASGYPFSDWPGASTRLIDRTSDSGFVFTYQLASPADSGLVIGKLTKNGTFAWIKRYPDIRSVPQTLSIDAGQLLISTTSQDPADTYIRTSSFIKTDSLGNIKEGVTSGPCYNAPLNGTITTTIQLDTMHSQFFYYMSTNDISSTSFTPMIRNVPVRLDANCVVPGNCERITLSGPDTVCSFLDGITFHAGRNAGCINAVNWIVDTNYATILARTDSTVIIRFKRSGQTSVLAQINSGCKLISQNKLIVIPPLSQEISLGDDKTICPGNQFMLQAGGGYRSYLWQDGSTDPVFIVTHPGVYHVRVTDVCNRAASDTVVVSPATSFSVNLGPDIPKCDTQSVTLVAPAGFAKYTWAPAYNISSLTVPAVTVNPDTSTSYHVLVERADGCKSSDTVRVIVHHAPRISLGNDTSFCTGQSIVLNVGPGFVSYTWNTGAATQQITANAKGIYHVLATDGNSCLSRDTLEVRNLFPLPAVNIGKDTFFCIGSNYTFDPGNFLNYEWNDGSAGRRFTATQVGSYWVKVTDGNFCTNSDTAQILRIAPLPQGFLDSVFEFCPYEKATLSSNGNYSRYRWSTGSSSRTTEVNAPGRYWLEVTSPDGCVDREYIDVKHKTCPAFIYFPNAFTPNNDRVNDTYKPVTSGKFTKYRFIVYNRWGQKVFETNDPSRAWDGTIGGLPQDSNAFVWYCSYQFAGEPEKNARGTLMLVR
jgi:gliding motility-associated-like protein